MVNWGIPKKRAVLMINYIIDKNSITWWFTLLVLSIVLNALANIVYKKTLPPLVEFQAKHQQKKTQDNTQISSNPDAMYYLGFQIIARLRLFIFFVISGFALAGLSFHVNFFEHHLVFRLVLVFFSVLSLLMAILLIRDAWKGINLIKQVNEKNKKSASERHDVLKGC